ncbi:MAG: ABC transporter ATP-binding protein/permease [Lachnospiraceae bacterium]|nr:ABC transporter ATP-binding protein/permease [Lachnospiraceae bacterium]
MFKVLKYLGESKAAVAAIIILLMLQAYCDLALPQYTADIVDVGIGQAGIENAVPLTLRSETMENLALFMTEQEASALEAAYTRNEEGNYDLILESEEEIGRLDKKMGIPMVILSAVSAQEEVQLPTLKEMLKRGELSREQILQYGEDVLEKYGSGSESMTAQMAVAFVKAEYQAMGVDLASVQTDYLLNKGSRMLLFTVIMMAASILAGLLAARTSAKMSRDLRGQLFSRVISFSDAEMDRFSTASLITRSTNDIQQMQMVMVMLLRMVLYAPIVGLGGVLKVLGTKTGMAWIIAVAVAAIMLLVGVLMWLAMPKFKVMQSLVDRLNLVSREILTGLSVIRAFSREKFEEKRFDKASRELMKTQLFTSRVMTIMMPAMTLIMNLVTVMILWFGAKGVDMGNLQVGDMLAFITYTMQIVISFLMLTMISVMLPRAGVAAERIEEVLELECSIRDQEETEDERVRDARGEVRFENVSFRYPGAEGNVLENIDFTACPGETTAIIGSTGCGKSTLVRLIPRFYDVTEGRITIDGVDIRSLSQHRLHELLGYVPQKGVLFSGSIESNIRFAGDFITGEDMEEAARIAQAMEFIDSKPKRFQEEISQGGTNVSGGQKQRLSIARAIAKHPRICIFDDSFSALDYRTDVILRKALNEKLSDATVIIVAQRISTILHADRILVLDDGRIAGMGTHEELLRSCAEYQEIAGSQLSEAELKGGRA